MKIGVTIFTPTYNRCNTLPRLYKSLKKQQCKDFEWLIVDDGSSDNTKDIINNWIKEKKVNIRYIYQENHGKTYAYNVGVENAQYNLFYCVDSDDYIGDKTIQQIIDINNKIIDDNKTIGIMGYKRNIVNKNASVQTINVESLTVSELYRKYHFKDEIALMYKTEILKEHPFPIIKGEKFIPEAYLYDQLDLIGKCYFIKDFIYYYEYQNDGYTKNTIPLLKNNVQGYILYAKQKMEISENLKDRIRGTISYNIANFIAGNKIKHLKNKHIFLIIITYIPSYMYYLKKYKFGV